jgi:threonine/homoserine/homoserine lactone efflux protein
MSEEPVPSPRRLLAIRIFLVLFVLSAAYMAWFGVQQQRLHGGKGAGKSPNPYEDRSLFGR